MVSLNGLDSLLLLGLLAAATLCGCLASWGLSHALGAGGGRSVGPLAAVGGWTPVAFCVLVAIVLGHATLAVTLIYTSSLAAVTMVLGGALLFTPHAADDAEMHPAASASPMLSLGLPMAMLVWLVGFSGNVTPASALALFIAALAALDAWKQDKADPASGATVRSAVGTPSGLFRVIEAAVALALGAGSGWAAAAFTQQAASPLLRISPELLAVMPLAPLLLLPLFCRAALHARQGQPTSSVGLALGVVVLNMGILLPITAVAKHLIPAGLHTGSQIATTGPASTSAVTGAEFSAQMSLLGVPLLLWRLDNMLLVLVALVMLGVRIGYYRPGRQMGMALLLVYAGYFMMTIVMRLA